MKPAFVDLDAHIVQASILDEHRVCHTCDETLVTLQSLHLNQRHVRPDLVVNAVQGWRDHGCGGEEVVLDLRDR